MSQVNCKGVTYKNFDVAIRDPSTWNIVNKFESFDCNHLDHCVRRCCFCKNIMYDVNNCTLWINAHVSHTYTATCLTKTFNKKFNFR